MAPTHAFDNILKPGHIGSVRTRNRMIKTGASMLYWRGDETHINDCTLGYYDALARGGVGLLIVESPIIDYPTGGRWPERYRMDDDKYIPGMQELTAVIHKHGCPTFMQMCHDGPWQNPLFPGVGPLYDGPPIGASAVNLPAEGDFHRDVCKPLTIEEIEELVDKVANVAVRAQKSGFDGVDINAASSHLFHNFLSPYWNRRTDAYGGTQEKRTKILVDLIREIKKRAGNDFPVSVCINGIEIGQAVGLPDRECLTHENAKEVARQVQSAGADAIQVRSQWLGFHVGGFLPEQLLFPELPIPIKNVPGEYNLSDNGWGGNVYMSASIKKTVSIPIMVPGRIDAELGEKVLREGGADFIAMHRPLMADPEYPNKVASGQMDHIRPCTRCGTCLDEGQERHRRCRINPFLGEEKYTVDPADKKKKVLVVGGGPGGMESALIAALRGHEVTLCDKAAKLGGLLPMAGVVKGFEIEDLQAIVRYFQAEFKRLGVAICLKKAMDVATVEKMKPDVVILAEGGIVYTPDLPGIKSRNVLPAPRLHKRLKMALKLVSPEWIRKLTKLYLPVGKSAVVIGSGVYGMEVAEFLIKRGRKVTIVDTAPAPGIGMLDYRMGLIMPWFEKTHTRVLTDLKAIQITKQGVIITRKNGEMEVISADTVLPVAQPKPNLDFYNQLKEKVPEVYTVGDCAHPSMIVDAVRSGWETAKKI